MPFQTIDALKSRMQALGVKKLYMKPLAENDNCKQQVYCGGSFEVLRQLPFTDIREEPGGRRPNFKASLNFSWIDAMGHEEQAIGAQLILYPDYPEVRLSGFLRGCSIAPSRDMQPLPPGQRLHNNGPDGRVLFLGVTETNMVYAYLATAGSNVAMAFMAHQADGKFDPAGVFWTMTIGAKVDSRDALIKALGKIHAYGWHPGCKLNTTGKMIAYKAKNGGGYTLEALLGIKPNARAEPDFLGWEIKAVGSDRVTLMTPEPDMGYYGINGVKAFVRKYGRDIGNDVLYFTGNHKVGVTCKSSGQTMELSGFDAVKGKIRDVSGGIFLMSSSGELSAGWSYRGLIEHWGRKHAAAAYVPYDRRGAITSEYFYKSPVYLGEGTDFDMYLKAMHAGSVIYDPGSKVVDASTPRPKVKARSQFRISFNKLPCLYKQFGKVNL